MIAKRQHLGPQTPDLVWVVLCSDLPDRPVWTGQPCPRGCPYDLSLDCAGDGYLPDLWRRLGRRCPIGKDRRRHRVNRRG